MIIDAGWTIVTVLQMV